MLPGVDVDLDPGRDPDPDHAGALGLELRPISGARLLGAALLVAGVVLVRR